MQQRPLRDKQNSDEVWVGRVRALDEVVLERLKERVSPPSTFTVSRLVGAEEDQGFVGRLGDFGFRSGVEIEWLGHGPFAGVFIFRVSGTVVALRREEMGAVLIEDTGK